MLLSGLFLPLSTPPLSLLLVFSPYSSPPFTFFALTLEGFSIVPHIACLLWLISLRISWVERTAFLLTVISDVKLREVIHRATNKVEQYNALEDWVRFAGGGTMYAHAFEEQEKLVKYTGLLTNCIILDNTLEISAALNALAREGYRPTIDELTALSPYQTRHIKRFGNYEIDFSAVPALIADDLTFPLEPPPAPSVIEADQEN